MVPIRVPQDPSMGLNHFYGLGYEEGSFWISSRTEDRIYELSLFGEITGEIASPYHAPCWLAGGEKELLVRYPDGRFALLETEGEIIGSFESSIGGGPLALSSHDIWVADGDYPDDESSRLYRLDLDRSLDSGDAVIIGEIVVEGVQRVKGLAYEDDRLWIIESGDFYGYWAADSLHIYELTSAPIVTYALPVHRAGALAVDEESIWIMHRGPRLLSGGEYCRSDDPVISRFRLR